MTSLQVFRSVVAASFLTGMAAVIYSFGAESGFSQDWQDLLAWNGNGGVFSDNFDDLSATGWVMVVAMLLLLLVAVVNNVLFFFCWRHSRGIYLWTWIAAIGITLCLGLNITTPIEEALLQASTFLSGVALALAYCSPIAEHFVPRREVSVATSPDVATPTGPSDSH